MDFLANPLRLPSASSCSPLCRLRRHFSPAWGESFPRGELFAREGNFQGRTLKPRPSGATTMTAASGGYRELLLGQRPAKHECFFTRSDCWEPQPGEWHCVAMTERVFLLAHGQVRKPSPSLLRNATRRVAAPSNHFV